MNLKHIHDETLLIDTKTLVKSEREILSKVLWHLYEIDQRKLYCDVKCGSLYEYCIRILKYSEGQASRRVTAARLLKSMPEIQTPIVEGLLNLTQIGMIKSHVQELQIENEKEKKKVIAEIIDEVKGKTTRDTDKILKEKSGAKPQKVNLRLEQETVDQLQEIKALKAHSVKDMDELLQMMSAEVKKLWDPTFVKRKAKETTGESRYVAVKTKSDVWKKNQGRCANCGSNYALQMDHIHPFSKGGKTKAPNMQLLCRNCNQRKADGVHVNRSPGTNHKDRV
jgi:hypothetical protein